MNRTKIRPLGKTVSTTSNSNSDYADYVYMPDTGISSQNINDPTTLKQLTDDIHMLNKESHKQIYVFLRKHKPSTFFTQETNTVIFNRDMLTANVLVELHNLVHLCKQNEARQSIIDIQKKQYHDDMDSQKRPSKEVEIEDNPLSLSEQQKFVRMLDLNDSFKS